MLSTIGKRSILSIGFGSAAKSAKNLSTGLESELCCNGDVDVSAAGTGSPILDSLVRLSAPDGMSTPAATTSARISNDSVGPLLQLLSTPQIHDLLHSIDAHRLAQDPAVLDRLLQSAGDAVAHHDVPRALGVLTEYINRNPEHAGVLPASPALMPIQGEVRELLRHITDDARIDAVRLIAAAGLVLHGAAKHSEGLNGLGVLAVAERFVEAGQLVNYMRAAELSQAVIAFYNAAPSEIRLDVSSGKTLRRPVLELVGRWWRRVPVLVLLVGWFAIGVAGGGVAMMARIAPSTVEAWVEVWSVGFLVLVVLQFWISVRGIR